MKSLIAPSHIIGSLRGVPNAKRVRDERAAFVAKAAAAGYTANAIGQALGLKGPTVRNAHPKAFQKPEVEVKQKPLRSPRAVVNVAGQPVSLPPLPFEITHDPRHETAPRHRGLVGSRVERDDPVDHTDRILSALMHADTLQSGAQQ